MKILSISEFKLMLQKACVGSVGVVPEISEDTIKKEYADYFKSGLSFSGWISTRFKEK